MSCPKRWHGNQLDDFLNYPDFPLILTWIFSEELDQVNMENVRNKITEHIHKYMTATGYQLSEKSKLRYALDSFVYGYRNAGGIQDNLKIEINYMLRSHVLHEIRKEITLPWRKDSIAILSLNPIEIFGTKIVALLNRTAARDLYDINNLQKSKLFITKKELLLLRKCIVFYCAISSKKAPEHFDFSPISKLTAHKIKTDLIPVLRRGEYFDLELAQQNVSDYLQSFLLPETDAEHEFWKVFNNHMYRPDILFSDKDLSDRLKNHPMALWKCNNRK